jgi:predicted transcriptional regulator
VHTWGMADTTVKIDTETRDRFAALAEERGLSVRAYLAELSIAEENQVHLRRAANAFRTAVNRPGFADAFDRDFGGAPAPSRTSHQAA